MTLEMSKNMLSKCHYRNKRIVGNIMEVTFDYQLEIERLTVSTMYVSIYGTKIKDNL